jgi:hypothetical protein
MIWSLMFILQVDRGEAQVPDVGVRVSVWFIGMFFLAVGAALLYLRRREIEDERKVKIPLNSRE